MRRLIGITLLGLFAEGRPRAFPSRLLESSQSLTSFAISP